ncbi:Protein kinase-like domain superfamily [Sesbania bispinosa]|nr:Protein kinase-like domain superfamily [Sesbania bispinosa]
MFWTRSRCNLKTEERRDEIVDLCCNQDAHGDSSAVFDVPCVSAITKSDSDLTNQVSRKICKLSFAPEQTKEAFDVAGNNIKLLYIALSSSSKQIVSQKISSDFTGLIGKECVDLWLRIANAVELFDQMPLQDSMTERDLSAQKPLDEMLKRDAVLLTPTHLAIVLENASGDELFERICNVGQFSEEEGRYFFQQLISGALHNLGARKFPLFGLNHLGCVPYEITTHKKIGSNKC